MKLLINIPKEFEQHFQADRFEDSLHRLSADAHLLAGLYEQETAKMLRDAFKNATPVPPHGALIDRDALMQHEVLLPMDGGHLPIVYASYVRNAPTIIPPEDGTTKDGGPDDAPAGPYDLLYEEGGPDA